MIEVQIDALQQKMAADWTAASSTVTDRLRRPSIPKDFPKSTAAEQRRKRWTKAADEVDTAFACAAPAMETTNDSFEHRHKDQVPISPRA